MSILNVWTHPYKNEHIPLLGYVPSYITPSLSEVETKKCSIESIYRHLETAYQTYSNDIQFVRGELEELGYSEKEAETFIYQFIEHYNKNSISLAKFIDLMLDK